MATMMTLIVSRPRLDIIAALGHRNCLRAIGIDVRAPLLKVTEPHSPYAQPRSSPHAGGSQHLSQAMCSQWLAT